MIIVEKIKEKLDDVIITMVATKLSKALKENTLVAQVPSIIGPLNRIYQQSAKKLEQQLKFKSIENITSLNYFTQTTTISSIIFRVLGDIRAEKEILDYYFNLRDGNKEILEENKINASAFLIAAKYQNLLRNTIVDLEINGNNSMVEQGFNCVEDYLFAQINNKEQKTNIIGEMALFNFALKRLDKAQDYLRMYYEKCNKKEDVLLFTEIDFNKSIDSSTIKDYISFVKDFLNEQNKKVLKM